MARAKVDSPSTDPNARARALPGRVMLVDDQVALRRIFRKGLERAGHEVVEAASGASALELARQQTFDLVVTDLRMPDMDGIDLLRKLREQAPDVPVILVSGAPDLPTAMQAVEYGAFEYLAKPLPLEKLRTSVQRGIELHRSRVAAKVRHEGYGSGSRPVAARIRQESWQGELLDGRYRVGRLLAEGGMGAVYEATREDLGNMRVAIKLVQPELAADPALLARFRREAETVAALSHPNIVRILDFRTPEAQPSFLVMELLDGVPLSHAIARHGQLSPERTVFITSQVLAALAAVHRAEVIHRDLKPENVFLTAISGLGDIVKLLDFGVAKPFASDARQTLTQAGAVLGTPAYMAPEQARGEAVDARSDLYAVGAIMYEALTGRPAFKAENYNALLFAIQSAGPTPLAELRPELDPELTRLVTRAMAPDPASRFQSAGEMADALQPWLAPDPAAGAAPESSALAFAPTIMPPSSHPAKPTLPSGKAPS